MDTPDPATALDARAGLPSGLDALLARHPREGWETHPEFGPLTRFWLDRHLGFRALLDRLRADAAVALDGGMDGRDHARRLARLGGGFLQGLHGHHAIEDEHYFPRLVALAPGLERGFGILDADHHRLHAELDLFERDATAVLRGGGRDALGPFADGLERMDRFLRRHLEDEEDLVVPVILDVGEGRLG